MLKITQLLELLFIKHRALTIAIIASVLIHILIASKASFKPPNQGNTQQAIEVRLSTAQTVQKSIPAPVVATQQPPHPEPSTYINKINNIADDINIQKKSADVFPIPSAELSVTTSEPNEIIKPSEVTSVVVNALPQPYRHIVTDFEVYRDNHVSAEGTARIVFDVNENGTYTLTSIAEASGLASLFLGALVQKSEGVFSDSGLRPNSYRYQYGSDIKKMQSANFSWSDGLVEMHSEKGKKTEALVVGTQDILSFMYQFMFTPPLENTEITLSNGKNIHTYSYSLQGEEVIAGKFGEINTIRLLKNGDDEKTELWLAIDYQYLPIKIRRTEKDGSVIEQIATKISTVVP